MFSKFKLNNICSAEFSEYYNDGIAFFNKCKCEVQDALSTFIKTDGKVDGSKLQEHWFSTESKYDVFLSHSHQDEELAISLAGYLKKEMQLSVFIDSCLWGYSNELLKEIDNNYCIHSNGTSYDYDKRNYSTSHVHMMLSIALANMIDRCESTFFLNTPNSISLQEGIQREETMSPWIYHEIATANTIRQKSLQDYRYEIRHFDDGQRMLFENASQLQITYDIDKLLKDFLSLSAVELKDAKNNWQKQSHMFNSALDWLYASKGILTYN